MRLLFNLIGGLLHGAVSLIVTLMMIALMCAGCIML
jgi:hypothetical protein